MQCKSLKTGSTYMVFFKWKIVITLYKEKKLEIGPSTNNIVIYDKRIFPNM